jgi:hypothetical protein
MQLVLIAFSLMAFAGKFEIHAPVSNLKFSTKPKDNLHVIYNTDKKNNVDFEEKNKTELTSFLSQAVPNAELPILNKERAEMILQKLRTNPVASTDSLTKYDPDREVGFCFGRATYVHMELLRHGVSTNHIAKIYAMGNLKYGKDNWDFHAAVAVWSAQKNWLVIDELVNEVMPLEQWMAKLMTFAKNPLKPRVRFFVVDPAKFHPALGPYQRKDMIFPYYHNYFLDMEKWLKKNPVKPEDKFTTLSSN